MQALLPKIPVMRFVNVIAKIKLKKSHAVQQCSAVEDLRA
jgi:hypothetical protein